MTYIDYNCGEFIKDEPAREKIEVFQCKWVDAKLETTVEGVKVNRYQAEQAINNILSELRRNCPGTTIKIEVQQQEEQEDDEYDPFIQLRVFI